MFKSKLLAVAGLALGAAFAVAPGIAHAQLPPPFQVPPPPPVPSTPSDVIAFAGIATITSGSCGSYVCLSGGGGTFNFTSLACVYVSDVDVTVPPIDGTDPAGTCTVTVNGGVYNNVVCGTGTASGTAVITGEGTNNDPFFIDFVATVGVVWGTDAGDPFYGAVLIGGSPFGTPGDPTAMQCVNGFSVTGAIVALDPFGAP
jgi:hypothetical protein